MLDAKGFFSFIVRNRLSQNKERLSPTVLLIRKLFYPSINCHTRIRSIELFKIFHSTLFTNLMQNLAAAHLGHSKTIISNLRSSSAAGLSISMNVIAIYYKAFAQLLSVTLAFLIRQWVQTLGAHVHSCDYTTVAV